MTKLIYFLSLLYCTLTIAQDHVIAAPKNNISETKSPVVNNIQIDSGLIKKRSFSKNFKSKYKDAAFVYEYKKVQKNAWDRFKDWLASVFQKIFQIKSKSVSISTLGIILKIIALAIIIFVIYSIVKAIINKDGQWIFGKNSNKKTITYGETEQDIHHLDFEKLIEKSNLDGNKRITIRYYYLWLLKVMATNNYIKWDIEKTNSDYLYEIQSPKHRNTFSYLSYLYNYIWYGEFDLDQKTYENTVSSFKEALKTFSNE